MTKMKKRAWRNRPLSVVLGKSGVHGLGVFANRNFKKGDIVEICPIMAVDGKAETILLAKSTDFGNFVFETDKGCALAMGYGSSGGRRTNSACS